MCICKYICIAYLCFNNIYLQEEQRKQQCHQIKKEKQKKNMEYDGYKTSCSHPHRRTCKPISKIYRRTTTTFLNANTVYYPDLKRVQHRKIKCVYSISLFQ